MTLTSGTSAAERGVDDLHRQAAGRLALEPNRGRYLVICAPPPYVSLGILYRKYTGGAWK
jgi:hypothetical protein